MTHSEAMSTSLGIPVSQGSNELPTSGLVGRWVMSLAVWFPSSLQDPTYTHTGPCCVGLGMCRDQLSSVWHLLECLLTCSVRATATHQVPCLGDMPLAVVTPDYKIPLIM